MFTLQNQLSVEKRLLHIILVKTRLADSSSLGFNGSWQWCDEHPVQSSNLHVQLHIRCFCIYYIYNPKTFICLTRWKNPKDLQGTFPKGSLTVTACWGKVFKTWTLKWSVNALNPASTWRPPGGCDCRKTSCAVRKQLDDELVPSSSSSVHVKTIPG